MFPPKVPSSDVTWGSIGGPLRRGPLYHDGSLASEENHLKGSYVSEWAWCTKCMKSSNQCFDPGKVFFGRSVDIQTSGRCEQMEMRQILMWSPQCVRTKKHRKDKHGPKMGTSLEFRIFKSSWEPRRYSWILYPTSHIPRLQSIMFDIPTCSAPSF